MNLKGKSGMLRTKCLTACNGALQGLDKVYDENRKGLTVASSVAVIGNLTMVAASASDIFTKAKSMMNTIYVSIAGISSVTAGCVAAVCLFLMFFSKNQNTVQESIQWLKRIFVCWLAIMLMSSIIYFVTNNLGISDNVSLT